MVFLWVGSLWCVVVWCGVLIADFVFAAVYISDQLVATRVLAQHEFSVGGAGPRNQGGQSKIDRESKTIQ